MANRTAPRQQNARTVSVNSRAGVRLRESCADRRARGGDDRLREDINAMLMRPSRHNPFANNSAQLSSIHRKVARLSRSCSSILIPFPNILNHAKFLNTVARLNNGVGAVE
ncbi:hypothetical protein TSUD_56120 [Trifolium subterraneum]|uniref:Uncharacterized protein n=1 Tax=Trifolium subterraneum TaxID=3900 RepID=A0A2Z6M1G4_TRISU|nr:hypothetical protein TSUD_56120 [Trifolium subterraneum]